MSVFHRSHRHSNAKIASRRKLGVLETLEQRTVLSLMPFLPGVGELAVSGDTLYFAGGDGQNYPGNLWKTDGTLDGTMQVTNQPPYFEPSRLTDVDGTLFFSGMSVPDGVELWRSDGTLDGTQFVADVNPNNFGGPGPSSLTNINGTLYFTGGWWSDVELWRSDGTAAGTYEVADIHPVHGSGPNNMIAFDGDVFFTANDGVHGFELWRSDGTAAGTRLVKDIRPGPEGAGEDNNTDFKMTVAGDNLYFIAEDGEHGRELWTSDGTTEGTHLVLDITPGPDAHVNSLVAYDNALYFSIYGGPQLGLWRSDGTAEGTVRVNDLVAVWGLTVAGDTLYFSASDGEHGPELWKSLGTAETTQMVADAIPGPDGSSPAWLEPAPLPDGGWVVFYAGWDGQESTLYRSDGTAAGTVIVRHSAEFAWPSKLVYFNEHIYFVGYQRVLWRTSVVNVGPPVADAGGPYTLDEGQSLALDASATTDPDPADILEYAWDINGDGDFSDATGVTPTLTAHELLLLGLNATANSNIRVRVRDGNGGETVSAPAALDISLVPPVVTGVHLSASAERPFMPKFISLGDLPGGAFASFGSAISSDGNVIVGYGTSATTVEPFRWTPSTGLVGLGLPADATLAVLTRLSADGSTAVGYFQNQGWPYYPQDGASEEMLTQENSYRHPFRWTEAGFVRLDSPNGSYGSETPAGISADGSVAVGTAYWDDGYLGVQWDASGHATLIGGPSLWGSPPGGPAYAVSADGSAVYGEGQWSYDIGGEIFYWTPETGAVTLGVHGRPVVTSADGSVVVANTPHGILVVRPEIECEPVTPSPPSTSGPGANCTVTTSTTPLPQAHGFHTAWDASEDASVIVGAGEDGAVVWDERHGARLVADVLREQGYVLDHWTLTAATGVSADGTVLVGYGINAVGNPEAWRADLSPVVLPTVGSGEQLRPIGQVGIDQISISFSEDVAVAADDLVVAGGNVDHYEVSQFAYDPATHTAVWRLAQPIAADSVQITLASGAAGVRDVGSVALDGEWDNPTSISDPSSDTFPSGDGSAGGDFVFRFNVLAGDVDGDGAVGRGDLAMLVQQGFKRQGDAGFDPRCDLDGDGVIGALDAMFARDHLGDVTAAPAAVRARAAGADSRSRRVSASRHRAVTTPERVDVALAVEASATSTRSLRSTRRSR